MLAHNLEAKLLILEKFVLDYNDVSILCECSTEKAMQIVQNAVKKLARKNKEKDKPLYYYRHGHQYFDDAEQPPTDLIVKFLGLDIDTMQIVYLKRFRTGKETMNLESWR
jgi:hypothetical protein